MKYGKRDLRAFDMFALILFGAGALFLTIGIIGFVMQPRAQYALVCKTAKGKVIAEAPRSGAEAFPKTMDARSDEPVTVEKVNLSALSNTLLGIVFIALALALNTALRRVIRNKGVDAGEPIDQIPDDETAEQSRPRVLK